MPVYNEAQSIEETIKEINDTLNSKIDFQFIISEDLQMIRIWLIEGRIFHATFPLVTLPCVEPGSFCCTICVFSINMRIVMICLLIRNMETLSRYNEVRPKPLPTTSAAYYSDLLRSADVTALR